MSGTVYQRVPSGAPMTNQLWAEQEPELRRLWADPALYLDDVAAALGRSPQAMRLRAAIIGLPPKKSTPPADAFWNPDRVALFKRLFDEGFTYPEMTRLIGRGCTKNMVIGKARRMGWKREEQAQKNPMAQKRVHRASNPKPAAPRNPPRPKPTLGPDTRGDGCEVVPAAPTRIRGATFLALEGSKPLPFGERRFNQCSWPIDPAPGGDLLSCCLPVSRGSWCEAHADRGLVAPRAPVSTKVLQLRNTRRHA